MDKQKSLDEWVKKQKVKINMVLQNNIKKYLDEDNKQEGGAPLAPYPFPYPYTGWQGTAPIPAVNSTYSYGNPTIGVAPGNTYVQSGSVYLGRNADSNTGHNYGYITNVRIIKGTGLYTGNFTPPTAEIKG